MHSSWALLTFMVILLVHQATTQSCSLRTKKCKKAKGFCIANSEPCLGLVKTGKKWCKDGKNCKCCIGQDKACGDGAEQPACKVLGGSCMNKDDECNGREVFSQYFCSGSSCKCCIPQEVCASCKEKAGTQCGGDLFGMTYGGMCRDICDDGEIRFGDCGPNCGCCVSTDVPGGSCTEVEQPCSGNPFGIPYSGICRTNCAVDEIRMGPCGNSAVGDVHLGRGSVTKFKQGVSRNDDNCGCCIKVEFPAGRR